VLDKGRGYCPVAPPRSSWALRRGGRAFPWPLRCVACGFTLGHCDYSIYLLPGCSAPYSRNRVAGGGGAASPLELSCSSSCPRRCGLPCRALRSQCLITDDVLGGKRVTPSATMRISGCNAAHPTLPLLLCAVFHEALRWPLHRRGPGAAGQVRCCGPCATRRPRCMPYVACVYTLAWTDQSHHHHETHIAKEEIAPQLTREAN
jgi:hypothetical protein